MKAKWLKRSAWVFSILFAGWVVYIATTAFYWQITIGEPLQRDLGFRYGRRYIRENGSTSLRQVTIFETIYSNSVMQNAGFREGDIVRGVSGNERYQLLHRSRGSNVSMQVVDGGDGLPLEERRLRTITFHVPLAKNE